MELTQDISRCRFMTRLAALPQSFSKAWMSFAARGSQSVAGYIQTKALYAVLFVLSLLTLRLVAHDEVGSFISFVFNIPRFTFLFMISIFVFVTFKNFFQKLVIIIIIIVILVVINDNDYREW